MLTEIYLANGIEYCNCGVKAMVLSMRTTDGLEVSGYPVEVYNVDVNPIGIAFDKDDYIRIWNGDNSNSSRGMISGASGLFHFKFFKNSGPKPDFVLGNPLNDTIGTTNYIITEDDHNIIQEDGDNLVTE